MARLAISIEGGLISARRLAELLRALAAFTVGGMVALPVRSSC